MDLLWKLVLVSSVLAFLANLFWLIYYRYSNPFNPNKTDFELKARIIKGLKKVFIYGGIAALILIPASFIYGARVRITYHVQTATPDQFFFSQNQESAEIDNQEDNFTSRYAPSRSVGFTTPMVFYGSFLLYFIGAFGMATLPLSLIMAWMKRPRQPEADEIVMSKLILKEETNESIKKLKKLIQQKEEIEKMNMNENHDKVTIRTKIAQYQKDLLISQENLIRFEKMRTTKQRRHDILEENPLKYVASLIAGIISIFLSLSLITHSVLMMFNKPIVLESIFGGLQSMGMVTAILGYVIISFYLLFCILKGFEDLSFMFPQYLGYNQMKMNRTWMDTWLIIANILIPGSWAVTAYFLKSLPFFLSFLRGGQLMNSFVTKIEYIRPFYKYNIFLGFMVIFFILGIAIKLSGSGSQEELLMRLKNVKEDLKSREIKERKKFSNRNSLL
jgi:LMBR1 domain-containing protein 1